MVWSRKKLLFLTDVFPFPLDRGQRIRVKNLLAACARVFDTTFVGPRPDRDEDGIAVEAVCAKTVYVKPTSRAESSRRALRAAARAVPGFPRKLSVEWYLPYVAALDGLDLGQFDFIWAERPHLARLCPGLRPRMIVDLDDVEHVKIARRLKLQKLSPALAHDAYQYVLYRFIELWWSKRFMAAIVCSEQDAAYFAERGCTNVVTIPNGVVIPEVRPRTPPSSEAPLRIVFLGHLGHPPNVDALKFLASEIVPRVVAERPDACFEVVGPGVSAELRESLGKVFVFRGFVDDLGAALAEYDLLIAPLRFGSGTKLKVLEAMAHGIPIVTTTVGAEGLSIEHNRHALVADDALPIAEAILRLKGDSALARTLAANARTLAVERFSWTKIQDDAVAWLTGIESRR